jgi:uncharacterized membrane protein YoaK (UPF0700 family)
MPKTAKAMPDPVPPAPPALLPMLLSFVAGYVDSYAYLALFGLFVAQVTGSFIIAGAELARHDYGVAGKLLAIPAFLAAAAATAALIGVLEERRRSTLATVLALEAALLGAFAAMLLLGPRLTDVSDPSGIVAGLFGAMAMGTQSVAVRLLLRGVPQTNVMTGNMTQLGIETTELIRAWRRCACAPHDLAAVHAFTAARRRLWIVLAVAIGFIAGGAMGALAYATVGLIGVLLATVILCALAWHCRGAGTETVPHGRAR